MYWLIEEDSQIEVLINSGYKKAFIEVIPYSDNNHPINNKYLEFSSQLPKDIAVLIENLKV